MNKLMSQLCAGLLFATAMALTSCSEDGSSGSSSDGSRTGTGGSTARMTIVGDYLYAIAGSDIQLFTISQPEAPNPFTRVAINREIQTVFPYGDYLLIGGADGVHIMDNIDPASPQYIANFTHATAIDPVVAANGYAYVTLKSGPNNFIDDQLNVIDINNIADPQLILTTSMQAPEGLVIAGNKLFICDGRAGLKEFDISDPAKPTYVTAVAGVNCNDVIARDGVLYVITDTSFQQYDHSVSPPAFLSEFSSVGGA